jgi:CBS domain containing-hemolysin-like protein
MAAMVDFPAFRLILLPVLLGINGFFAAAEVALISVRPTRMRQLADKGDHRAKAVLELLGNPDGLLSATQLGITLASLGLGWAGEDTVFELIIAMLPARATAAMMALPRGDHLLHAAAFAVAFALITYLHMVVGEVVPKNVAFERTERLALAVGPALQFFARATHFFVSIVERSSDSLARLLGLKGTPRGGAHSAEELKMIVTASRRHGELPHSQEDMLHNVIDFYDVVAREVMVPRNEIVSISADATLPQVIRTIAEHQHSRMPVYEGSTENILGILYAKDVWPFVPAGRKFALRSIVHPHKVVPETKPLHQLLAEFQEEHHHMALVVDEFGTIAGLVTVEDALEQIVGEIRDEHDIAELPPAELADGPIELDGTTTVRDLENLYSIDLPHDAGFQTLAGFLLERLGAIPEGGEQVEFEGRRYTVQAVDGRRISRVRVEPLPDVPSPETQIGENRAAD